MPELVFPAIRFAAAGGTDEEIAQLVAEFEHSDVAVKSSQVAYYDGVGNADLGEYLDRLRVAGHFSPPTSDQDSNEDEPSEPEDTDEAEPIAAVSDPDSGSGAPAPAGEDKGATTKRAPAAH